MFFFQAEDGIRDLVRSRGLGDVYKRQGAEMAVYDVNGDGFNDVVSGLNAHGFGLAWFEQKLSLIHI